MPPLGLAVTLFSRFDIHLWTGKLMGSAPANKGSSNKTITYVNIPLGLCFRLSTPSIFPGSIATFEAQSIHKGDVVTQFIPSIKPFVLTGARFHVPANF